MGLAMFTGIINHVGVIGHVHKSKIFAGLDNSQYDDLQLGESIAVDGILLNRE